MKIRTDEGGDITIGDDLRDVLCFVSDGTLYISKTHLNAPNVRAFIGRLNRTNEHYEISPCELGQIPILYQSSTKLDSNDDLTQFQGKAIELFEKAVHENASDIHILVSKNDQTKIKFRVNGTLLLEEEQTMDYGNKLCSTIYQALTDVSAATFEHASPQDARISDKKKLPHKINGIRVATGPQVDGYIMVLRMLYSPSDMNLNLLSLGYTKDQQEIIEDLERSPTGITIISGSTGSGKSTTLQRVLTRIIKQEKGRINVLTVEDPPEYPIPGSVQMPVANANTEEERSAAFQLSIKAAMRLDPDIMMIGEVRDHPSASLAIKAALSGHPLWTTIHANSVFGIISRLVDIGVNINLVCDPTVVSGLVCQTLLRVLCPNCKVKMRGSDKITAEIESHYENKINIDTAYLKGDGCEHCKQTGVIGRSVAAEVIRTDYALLNLIKQDRIEEAMEYWLAGGGMTMKSHAITKVNEGMCDPFDSESIVGKF